MDNYRTEPIPDPTAPKPRRSGSLRVVIDILETIVLSVLLFVAINAISARIRVDGFSMEPTLQSGEFVVVNKLAYKFGEPQVGDVIIFQYPRDPDQEYIKRVIGTPDDHVKIENGLVYVNGVLLNEPYVAAQPAYQNEWTIPDNTIFVLGDNRNNSSDSHTWGPVPIDYVIGKALFVYWPPERWGVVEHVSAAGPTP
ncbi:MAG: signal peptidase I [Chloroflexota bacterium]|nr:signal peptidase I [Chloroflexota bacterium]